MIDKRTFIAGLLAGLSARSVQARTLGNLSQVRYGDGSFRSFLDSVRAKARRLGLNRVTTDKALSLSQPNARVLALDRHQAEFTLTWSQYRQRVLTDRKIQAGRLAFQERSSLFKAICRHDGVDPGVILGIWGLESNYGDHTGTFTVIDALATLAFNGRRASFFISELLCALQILDQGDVGSASMLGSYAGAMGQPQFMPSSYLRYAVDYDGDGRRDIWTTDADVLASISNYLKKNGWVSGEPWGQVVSLSSNLDDTMVGRQVRHPLDTWMRMGVRRADGTMFSRGDVIGSVLLPSGAAGEAFIVYNNFDVIRRYNPSDYYSLAVGLLGNATA